MPAFKDEHIIIIAPGSQTTLAQLGLPESFTPARLRLKTRMFPSDTPGQWEPYKVRRKQKRSQLANGASFHEQQEENEDPEYEEDPVSDEGAVWPIQDGRIANWPCFFALMHHVHNLMGPPFHTPILLVAQPCWTPKDHEKLTQFFFEKFKTPGFAIIDAAQAACYGHNVPTATVIDVGSTKADVTTIVDHLVDDVGRARALVGCGGDAMTGRLQELLKTKGFSWEMCEQLKKSPICEILHPDVPLPGTSQPKGSNGTTAAASTTGAEGPGKDQRSTQGAQGGAPRGPGLGTEIGVEPTGTLPAEDNEGVLDVASIVTSGKMNDYLEKKEKEKAEKNAAKKKGGAADAAKPVRLKNSEREKNTFYYEDHSLLAALRGSNMDSATLAAKTAAMDEGPKRAPQQPPTPVDGTAPQIPAQPPAIDTSAPQQAQAPAADQMTSPATTSPTATTATANQPQVPRRELSVGTERFLSHTPDLLLKLSDAVHRTIQASPAPHRRQDLWDSLIIIGNGSKVRGFKEALLHTLQSRFIISPSNATMLTGDIPSSFTTPGQTGSSTPIPGLPPGQMPLPNAPSGVNPLLYAATTANHGPPSTQGMMTPGQLPPMSNGPSQTPTRIRMLDIPGHFPEWKEHGVEEAPFLGAQVAAKVVFVADVQGGSGKGWMSRSDYNESGPGGIGEFVLS